MQRRSGIGSLTSHLDICLMPSWVCSQKRIVPVLKAARWQAMSTDHCHAGGAEPAWRAVSVSQLTVGDWLFVLRQPAARHTGIAVEETCTER